MFEELERFNVRPEPFSVYTAEQLWTDPHTSRHMLAFHLDGEVDLASRTTDFIRRSVQWLTSYTGVGDGARVLDLGCGPGLYSNALSHTGAGVVGIDFSKRSITYAEQTRPSVPTAPTYIHGNYLSVEFPGVFDLVILAMYDFCALSPDRRRLLLERVRDALGPGGRFIFDVYGVRSLRERTETIQYAPNLMHGFWSSQPYHGFLHTFIYPSERVTLDKYEIIEATRTRTIFNWLQYFDPASLTAEVEGSGLQVHAVFGDLAGADLAPDPTEICAVATFR